MTVDVRLPTVMRQHAGGQATIAAEGETLGELFADLVARFPDIKSSLLGEDGQLHRFVNVYVNDDDVRYIGKLDAPVKEGDTVSILPAVAGG